MRHDDTHALLSSLLALMTAVLIVMVWAALAPAGDVANRAQPIVRAVALLAVGLSCTALVVASRWRRRDLHERALAKEEEHRLEHELAVLQETARVLSSTLDLDAVYTALVRTAALIVSPPGISSRRASILRLEEGEMVSVAEHDETGSEFTGSRYDLAAHPIMRRVVETREMWWGPVPDTPLPADTARRVSAAGLHAGAMAPLVVGGEVFGLMTVGSRDPEGFTESQLRRLESVAHLGELAIANAWSYSNLAVSAFTDPLTGLKNRREFERVLTHPPRERFSVLAIDVDNLKPINDEYGHEAGDAVLRTVAAVLGALVRTGDVLARVGGDEFAALLPGPDAEEAEQIADRMRAAMHGVSMPKGKARISIGIADGEAGEDPRAVWRAADAALYAAKRTGRDRVASDGDQPESEDGPTRWSELVRAVLAERTVPIAYQPVVLLADGAAVGYEALARPSGLHADAPVGMLFTTAHRMGLARDLDWICRRAAVAGCSSLPPGATLHVNVNASALLDPVHDVDQMLLLLHHHGLPPERVVLELTERETISDTERLREVLESYRREGFRFALDDVGEGFSTLEVLAAAMPEYLKLARSLVATIRTPGSRAAVLAAVAFARATGTMVIAEGVEDEATAQMLADLGVQMGQGHWLGAPVPEARMREDALDTA